MSNSPLPKLIAQTLNVLAPVQVGICQKTPGIAPGQWVKISQIIGMGCGRGSNMPNHQCSACDAQKRSPGLSQQAHRADARDDGQHRINSQDVSNTKVDAAN